MANSKKKVGKKAHSHKSRILDNALLHSAEKSPHSNFFIPTTEVKEEIVSRQVEEVREQAKHKEPVKHVISDNGKKVNVFEIISDLEKQLDAAFSLKDAQEEAINGLKEKLEKAEGEIESLGEKLETTKAKLVSQEKLRLELEAFENERYEVVTEKKSLKDEIDARSTAIKELENKIAILAQDAEKWDARMGQMELELTNTNATIQTLRHQIFVLEEEKEILSKKLETTEQELSSAVTDRDRSTKELKEAKESLDEIRLTLTDTQVRTRSRYYKTKSK